MQNLTCIVCPAGCQLEVNSGKNGEAEVTGNKCGRGEEYAREEIRSPKRVVTATMMIDESSLKSDKTNSIKRVPVKSVSPCPRENINAMLADIYAAKVKLPVKTGDVIIAGWKPKNGADRNNGIDIVATRTIG